VTHTTWEEETKRKKKNLIMHNAVGYAKERKNVDQETDDQLWKREKEERRVFPNWRRCYMVARPPCLS
jgi:hypothetical protein